MSKIIAKTPSNELHKKMQKLPTNETLDIESKFSMDVKYLNEGYMKKVKAIIESENQKASSFFMTGRRMTPFESNSIENGI